MFSYYMFKTNLSGVKQIYVFLLSELVDLQLENTTKSHWYMNENLLTITNTLRIFIGSFNNTLLLSSRM